MGINAYLLKKGESVMIENTNDTLTISVAKVKEIVEKITEKIVEKALEFVEEVEDSEGHTKKTIIDGFIEIIEDAWTDKHDEDIEPEAIKENVFL